ncbi:hypothetical protein IFM89_032654 [Coptis chinensis]|uniref:DUF4216 domain-containing protein n=1 Tax=Coptis chinensis TaxID=261450 RepID=A0A835IGY0_9MAGN|nr:hypothetical protein IFM89_032654 [Coptis chinensis]
MKLNPDSALSDDRCGVGGVIRDSQSQVLFTYSGGGGLRTVIFQELIAIFGGLKGCQMCQRNTNEDDEPFILASEAAQLFYCKDLSRDNWHVVLHAPKRLNHDVDVYEDPLVFEAMANSDGLASALMGDIDGVEV